MSEMPKYLFHVNYGRSASAYEMRGQPYGSPYISRTNAKLPLPTCMGVTALLAAVEVELADNLLAIDFARC